MIIIINIQLTDVSSDLEQILSLSSTGASWPAPVIVIHRLTSGQSRDRCVR